MKAKEFLKRVSKLDAIIQNKIIEKQQWEAIATSTTIQPSDSKVQSSGSKQKMESAVIRLVEIEAEIDEYLDRLVDVKMDVVRTIELLPTSEYDLLHKVYIQGKDLAEAAVLVGKSYTWATTVHGRALVNLQKILDERAVIRHEAISALCGND